VSRSIDMPLRSRKQRFRGWSEKDVRTSRRIRRGMPLLGLKHRKTTRSRTASPGHGDSQVSSERLAPTGCYSNIDDGANTCGLQLHFALCGERRCAVEAGFASDAHTMPSNPRRPIGIRRQPSNRVFWQQGPSASRMANTSCRTLPYSARWHDFLGTRKALPLPSRRSQFFSSFSAALRRR
jgi:hypothetical protein